MREKKQKWPTMRDMVVKMRHMPDVIVDASVSIDTGRPIVGFRLDQDDSRHMTPAEARRVATALMRAAICCEAKAEYARSKGTSVMNAELNS